MEAYIIHDDNSDEPVAIFKEREAAFSWLKSKADASYHIKPVPVFKNVDDMQKYTYYHATCNLGDSEIGVTEEVYFPEIEKNAPCEECGEVTQYGAKISCSGKNIEKVALSIRKFVAQKRYEFEHSVRKVCASVQPKIEAGEAMTVNQIVDESGINQDTVVKILILLKKEGFLDIVDPVEQQKEEQAKAISRAKRSGLWTPSQSSGKMGDPNKGMQANVPIMTKKLKKRK